MKKAILHTAEKCINCGICISGCAFLQKHGSPLQIAEYALSSESGGNECSINAYECSLCSLCSAICPVEADPATMFMHLRDHAQTNNIFKLNKHSSLLSYEKMGGKFPFKDNITPSGCETVFFPGCTLPALFPEATLAVYSTLKKNDKLCGLTLNC